MRFTLVKDLRKDALMRPLITGLLLFLSLFFISDLYQKKMDIGLDTSSVEATLYGDEAEFIDPISTEALLEIIHGDIFFMMMSLLSLSAVFGRVAPKRRSSGLAVHALNLFAFSSLLFLVTSTFFPMIPVIFWLVTMWGWHLLAIMMSLFSFYRLYR